MIEFMNISFRNFMSYGNNVTTVDLRRPGTTLIVGEDLDNTTDGAGANGVGKSSLINALAYAIYDKPVSKVSKDNLVNNINQKNMEVILEYVGIDGKQYKIHRMRKMKAGAAGNNVHFYEEGEDKTLDSMDATNARIEQTIGIPHELFVRIVVFSASNVPFLDLKTDEQKNIIEELFGITAISDRADQLKQLIRETEGKIEIRRVKIQVAEGEHQRHDQQIESAVKRISTWNAQNKQATENLKMRLQRISTIDFDGQQTLHLTLSELNTQLSSALDQQRAIKNSLREQIKVYTTAEQDLSHLRDAKCPYCLQQYADAKQKIDETETLFNNSSNRVDRLSAELQDVDDAVKGFADRIKDIKKDITVDDLEELLNIKNESDNIHEKIQELEGAINPFDEPLQELMDFELAPIDYDEINELTRVVEHQKFLHKLLTKKDSFIRKDLLNNNVPYLNARLQYYLAYLGLPHKVEFTKEMAVLITQFGRPLDFGNLSAGQRARVNFALSLAFRDVLQRLHPKINICMLDEVLDIGLDRVGVQAAARLVKQKAREEGLSMFIISHRDEIDSIFERKMVVQLQNSFSYIVESTS